jgi:uncharacterized protein (TIGR04255 family)
MHPRLSKPPIREAVVDIRCELPDGFSVAHLEALHPVIKDQYPDKKERQKLGFHLAETAFTAKNFGPVGFVFINDSKFQVAQFRLDGFTFSRLAPYENWNTLRDEAKRLWRVYCDGTKPTTISRVALRYINELNVPLDLEGWSKWLVDAPKAPPTAKTFPKEFLTRCVVDDTVMGTTWIVTQSGEKGPPPNLRILLDIDVFKAASFETDEAIWQTAESLRLTKNDVFFGSITEATKDHYR